MEGAPVVDIVLVSVDGSEDALAAAEYAVAVADRYDASLHALHVLEEETARALEAGSVEPDAVAASGQDLHAILESAAAESDVQLSTSAARGFSPRHLGRHPGTVVLDTAESIGADFIILPRETPAEGPAAVLEQAAQYVIAHASQPVLAV